MYLLGFLSIEIYPFISVLLSVRFFLLWSLSSNVCSLAFKFRAVVCVCVFDHAFYVGYVGD